jgi:hypothetical protein
LDVLAVWIENLDAIVFCIIDIDAALAVDLKSVDEPEQIVLVIIAADADLLLEIQFKGAKKRFTGIADHS